MILVPESAIFKDVCKPRASGDDPSIAAYG